MCFSPGFAQSKSRDKQTLAQELGWVAVPRSENICQGYYQEPYLDFVAQGRLKAGEVKMTANRSSLFQRGKSLLVGDVVIDRENLRVTAKRAEFQRDPNTGKINVVDFYDNVVLREQGSVVLADRATLYNQDKTGVINNAWYRLAMSGNYTLPQDKKAIARFEGLNAWGHAEKIEKIDDNIWRLKQADITTCSPLKRSWHIKSSRTTINKKSGRAAVNNAVFYAGDIPFFYTPYYNFPIDDRRETGFLFPSFGSSERSGFVLSAPFYWNLAPNYDVTLTPTLYTDRGVGLEANFRYLLANGSGNLDITGLPSDSEFPKMQREFAEKYTGNPRRTRRLNGLDDDRVFAHFDDKHQWSQHWSTQIDLNYVSDDYYFQDFDSGLYEGTKTQLNRVGRIDYQANYWQAHALLQDFETLHPINQSTINEPYQQLPQLGGEFSYGTLSGFTYQGSADTTYFDQRENPDTGLTGVMGTRVHAHPSLSYAWEPPEGYIRPQVQLHLAYYDLNNQVPGRSEYISKAIPMFNVDSGLYFDREWQFGKRRYRQTLEPRLFYLNVPFRDQSDIPVFDSAIRSFSFDQLFRTNRFSGEDRIGEADQLSMAFTSRLIDEDSGAEKARLSLGQTWYFRDRLVSLCTTFACQDSVTAVGATAETTGRSPLVGSASYHVSANWQATGSAAWDGEDSQLTNSRLDFHYQPDSDHIVDLTYGYTRNGETFENDTRDLHQGRFTFYWPLKQQWHTIGYLAYNFTLNRPQHYFYGLEYNNCCWAVRFVGERAFQALDPQGDPEYDSNFYVQILLKGLGNLGQSKSSRLLQTEIPGFYDKFKRG